ncbi:hypothetical protein Q3G72_004259 [Acer saccharum]|nr:hypothetical protein Q3G72_004259 [Acer saccharum]
MKKSLPYKKKSLTGHNNLTAIALSKTLPKSKTTWRSVRRLCGLFQMPSQEGLINRFDYWSQKIALNHFILKKYWDLEEGEEQNQQQGLTFDNIELNLPPGGSCKQIRNVGIWKKVKNRITFDNIELNLPPGGSCKQIRLLVTKDCIESLCDFLDYANPRTVKILKKYWDLEECEEQNQQQGLTFDNIELNLPSGGFNFG